MKQDNRQAADAPRHTPPLRRIRIALASVCFLLLTWLFLDFTGTAQPLAGWLAKIQFLPAVMALNLWVVAGLVVLTLIFGRIYCSVICPLGVLQDLLSHLRPRGHKKVGRYSYSPEVRWLRYPVLALFVIALVAGVGSFVALLAPYSSFGRIASNLFAPLYQWGNNGLAAIAEQQGSYAFYHVDVWMRSLPTFLIAAASLAVLAILAWVGGRTYCNTICPVGTVLSFLSRFSMFRPVIDTEKCRDCHVCEKKCKSSCIDIANHKIDYSRCVDCFDCLDNCRFGALKYRFAWGRKASRKAEESAEAPAMEHSANSRRKFLSGAGALALGTVAAKAQMKMDGGYASILERKKPERKTPIVPPGAQGLKHLADRCTACQLCVSECPNDVLRPSTDLSRFMQPESSYERGYCRPECTRCSEVCPTGAILPITPEEKTDVRIGHAVPIRENCVVLTDGVSCGNCARHCPVGAIMMVLSDPEDPESLRIPAVNEARCIGCGACESVCPSRPYSAIYVEGHEVHGNV